jgi:hypothetical protein
MQSFRASPQFSWAAAQRGMTEQELFDALTSDEAIEEARCESGSE